MPERIQRKRSKGWKKPPGSMIVDRTSRWGNPFVVGKYNDFYGGIIQDAETAISLFIQHLTVIAFNAGYQSVDNWLYPLQGKNLCCWCPLDQPCHADVLLRLANKSLEPTEEHGGSN